MLSEIFQYCLAALMLSTTAFVIIWMFFVLYYSNKVKGKGRG